MILSSCCIIALSYWNELELHFSFTPYPFKSLLQAAEAELRNNIKVKLKSRIAIKYSALFVDPFLPIFLPPLCLIEYEIS